MLLLATVYVLLHALRTHIYPAHLPGVLVALAGKQRALSLMVCTILWREGRVGRRVWQGYVGGYAWLAGWVLQRGMLTLQGYNGYSNSHNSNKDNSNNNKNNTLSQQTPVNLCILCSSITVALVMPATRTPHLLPFKASGKVFPQSLSTAARSHTQTQAHTGSHFAFNAYFRFAAGLIAPKRKERSEVRRALQLCYSFAQRREPSPLRHAKCCCYL